MKKRKTIKKITFSALALVMATAGILAFAPMGASASEPTTTTTGLGLDPKNDPIVYTTESGLEIRMSNAIKYTGTATTTTNKNQTYTQDLTGFYYFTMVSFTGTIYTGASTSATYSVSNQPVNWVILGLGENTAYFLDEVAKNLFSIWQTNSNILYSNGTSGSYFFNEIYETYSPAGELIDSIISSSTYIMDKIQASIPIKPEIPDGSMLVLSEKLLGQMYFDSSGNINGTLVGASDSVCSYTSGNSYLGNRYRYKGNVSTANTSGKQTWTISGNAGGDLYNYINSLFSKNTSGTILTNALKLTQTQSNLIVPQQLYTYYSNGSGYHYQESPSTDNGTYYTMFPLAYRGAYSSITQSFCFEDYLPNQNQRVASLIGSNQTYYWWTRSGASAVSHVPSRIAPDGSCGTNGAECAFGVRPAMVMKLQ